MGKPVKILKLAEDLISLSGLKPYEDIKIEFTGLRPGEKMYEELVLDSETRIKTDNDLIFVNEPMDISREEINRKMSQLQEIVITNDTNGINQKILEIIL